MVANTRYIKALEGDEVRVALTPYDFDSFVDGRGIAEEKAWLLMTTRQIEASSVESLTCPFFLPRFHIP